MNYKYGFNNFVKRIGLLREYDRRLVCKKSRLKKALVITLLISLLCTNVALANGNETNMKNLGLIDSKFNINSDVMKKIENALSLKPDLINYFNGSIEIFNNGIHTNSSDYNQYLSDMAMHGRNFVQQILSCSIRLQLSLKIKF